MADIKKMLELCRTRQWDVDKDLDWSVKPRAMSREEEMNTVQFFTNMAGIERLAKALFFEQAKRAETADLKEIFESFVVDEERHAIAAERLAQHYNVHKYKNYKIAPAMARFREPFLEAIRRVSPEVANAYVTAGELMLDIALLRSVNSYVDDEMSSQVMQLINRDEARHVAMDYHMTEYYASAAYQARIHQQGLVDNVRDIVTESFYVGRMMYFARPFLKKVFLDPMKMTDPEGERIKEAFKRIQLLSMKPEVAKRPLSQFMQGVRGLYNTPVIGFVFGGLLSRILGAPGRFLVDFYDEHEKEQAIRMSFDDMAEEAMHTKY